MAFLFFLISPFLHSLACHDLSSKVPIYLILRLKKDKQSERSALN